MKPVKPITPLLMFVILGIIGCSAGTSEAQLPATEPDIKGTITRIDETGEFFHMMVEENPLDPDASVKSRVRVADSALILDRSGGELHEIGRDRLKEGAIVSVWFDGPVLQSYPSQSGAKIVLLEGEVDDSR